MSTNSLDILSSDFERIKLYIFGEVEKFCASHQTVLSKSTLTQNIDIKYEDFENSISTKPIINHIQITKPKRKLKLKVKKPDSISEIESITPQQLPSRIIKKTLKLKPKLKLKLEESIDDYTMFVNICKDNNFEYFEFYDENNWIGPAINIELSEIDKVQFHFIKIKLKILSGTNFYLLRPNVNLKDTIVYPDLEINSCKLENISLIGGNSDSDDVYDAETDDDVELDVWTHNNTKYQLDLKTNTLYSWETNMPIGRKIDEFNIEFD